MVAWAVSAEVVMGARRESALKQSDATHRFHQVSELNNFHASVKPKLGMVDEQLRILLI